MRGEGGHSLSWKRVSCRPQREWFPSRFFRQVGWPWRLPIGWGGKEALLEEALLQALLDEAFLQALLEEALLQVLAVELAVELAGRALEPRKPGQARRALGPQLRPRWL